MSILRPPFPTAIDSTMVAAFRACPRKFAYEYLEHWKPLAPSIHLHAGGAFARGLEVARRSFWEDGVPPEDALEKGVAALTEAWGDFQCPEGEAKSLDRMVGAMRFMCERYPLEGTVPHVMSNGRRAIEFSAVHPLPINHPMTGDPMLYSGRYDMIIDWLGGIFLEDDKTTKALGASWAKQWDLRSQFTGYAWLTEAAAGIRVNGVLVRGVSILKTKFDSAQAVSYRHDWMIERWLEQTCRDINRMINCWEEGYWDLVMDHACDEYGGCPFKQVCLMKAPQDLLPIYFERRRWDPIARQEEKL